MTDFIFPRLRSTMTPTRRPRLAIHGLGKARLPATTLSTQRLPSRPLTALPNSPPMQFPSVATSRYLQPDHHSCSPSPPKLPRRRNNRHATSVQIWSIVTTILTTMKPTLPASRWRCASSKFKSSMQRLQRLISNWLFRSWRLSLKPKFTRRWQHTSSECFSCDNAKKRNARHWWKQNGRRGRKRSEKDPLSVSLLSDLTYLASPTKTIFPHSSSSHRKRPKLGEKRNRHRPKPMRALLPLSSPKTPSDAKWLLRLTTRTRRMITGIPSNTILMLCWPPSPDPCLRR